jgi:hypothetical protein
MWQIQAESNANKIRKIIRERCNDRERNKLFSNIREKISLVFYCEMKRKWGKEKYIDELTRKEKLGIIWLKAGIWDLRWIRRGSGKGRCPLCSRKEDAKHMLVKCPEPKKWREELVCSKWLNVN